MARPLRFVPPGAVVEVTARTTGSRFLLRPSEEVNDLVLGVLGRAQWLYGVQVFGIVVMSNHLHMLLGVTDAAQLAGFMRHALGNIAQEVGRHHRWSGRFWGRRYRSIVVADEPAQVARLAYIFGNGTKENLVERPEDWPGVTSARALAYGERLWAAPPSTRSAAAAASPARRRSPGATSSCCRPCPSGCR
jgi:REP element-mobilizing transposase RayT